MRLIPKNTKVKIKFYKNIGIIDVLLILLDMGLIALAMSSNMPNKYVIVMAILIITIPLFIPIEDGKLYTLIGHYLKYISSKKKFSRKQSNLSAVVPYSKIEENLIRNDTTYVGIIEITPLEFSMISESKQDFIIDNVMANIIKSTGIYQELNIIKLEKPVLFDNYIKNEYTRMQDLITSNENRELNEEEFRARIDVVEDRLNIVDIINNDEIIYKNAYYLALHDMDKKALQQSLTLIANTLKGNNIECKQLNDKELGIFLRYTYGKEFNERKFDKYEPKDYIKKSAPNEVIFKSASVKQDNKVLSQFVITDFPLKVPNAWATGLCSIPNTKVVFKIKPVEKSKAIKRIDNAITEVVTQNKSSKASVQIDTQTHIESLQSLLTEMQTDNEMLFDTTVIITAYDDIKSTNNKKMVRRKLKEYGFKYAEMFGRQIETYLSSTITTYNKTGISRGINSSSLGASFPFVSNELMDEDGILIGENSLPVFVDFFKRDNERVNSNMIIIGKSGSGKSYATKTILSGLASNNAKVFILDPENEYGKLTKNLKGKVLDVSSSKEGRLNPFHIISTIDDENSDGTSNSFYSHLQFLEEFFKVILVGASADSLELLNKVILEAYAYKKITAKTNIKQLTAKDYPTFEDLCNIIAKKMEKEKDEYNHSCLKILSNYLSKFKRGGRNSALWNGYTTFNPQENFVCFDFQKLLANKNNVIANAQMLLVLRWMENEVIKNREYNIKYQTNRKIVVAIDEAHIFIDEKYPIALDFMHNLAKRIRKYDGMQIVITQNVKDFIGTPEIARKSTSIINVSQYSMIFSLAPNDMSDLCALYEKAGQINDEEANNIVNLPRGSAFFITGPTNRTNISIVASSKTQELFEN